MYRSTNNNSSSQNNNNYSKNDEGLVSLVSKLYDEVESLYHRTKNKSDQFDMLCRDSMLKVENNTNIFQKTFNNDKAIIDDFMKSFSVFDCHAEYNNLQELKLLVDNFCREFQKSGMNKETISAVVEILLKNAQELSDISSKQELISAKYEELCRRMSEIIVPLHSINEESKKQTIILEVIARKIDTNGELTLKEIQAIFMGKQMQNNAQLERDLMSMMHTFSGRDKMQNPREGSDSG